MGFNTLHGMETNVNETIVNYGYVGFGLIMDTRLEPLMRLGLCGSLSLALGSMNDLVILIGSLVVWSWLYTVDGGDSLVNEGMLRWFHDNI